MTAPDETVGEEMQADPNAVSEGGVAPEDEQKQKKAGTKAMEEKHEEEMGKDDKKIGMSSAQTKSEMVSSEAADEGQEEQRKVQEAEAEADGNRKRPRRNRPDAERKRDAMSEDKVCPKLDVRDEKRAEEEQEVPEKKPKNSKEHEWAEKGTELTLGPSDDMTGANMERKEEDESYDEDAQEPANQMAERVETEGERILTASAARPLESTLHTILDRLQVGEAAMAREGLSAEEEVVQATGSASIDRWLSYENRTASLSQQLCEQLRLLLEPTQAARMRGDYKTGRRLNMRKVIAYVASEFRKDKIWMRRSKPSKRNYQILLAVDDSSSMVDNSAQELALEAVCVLSRALSVLEVGQLAVCSFGEGVRLLHGFEQPFSAQAGTRLLDSFEFSQKKTNVAQMMHFCVDQLEKAKFLRRGQTAEVSQLLLIVSDGRGLFHEGMTTVNQAVRRAIHANVLVVFILLDNAAAKSGGSVLDIRVPVFSTPGKVPEIRSYMDHFPFPFYIILRQIQALPEVLSDALRQWFELVTAGRS